MADAGKDKKTVVDKVFGEYFREPTPEETRATMRQAYTEAAKRLELAQKTPENDIPLQDYLLTKVYQLKPHELAALNPIDRDILARKNIYQDLGITCFFNPDGTPSQFNIRLAERFGLTSIDLDDYEPDHREWHPLKQFLEEKAPRTYGGPLSPDDKYFGNIPIAEAQSETDSSNSDDPLQRYVAKFTQPGEYPAAVAIPLSVKLRRSVQIDNQTGEFKEPFGGNFCDRVVFFRKA